MKGLAAYCRKSLPKNLASAIRRWRRFVVWMSLPSFAVSRLPVRMPRRGARSAAYPEANLHVTYSSGNPRGCGAGRSTSADYSRAQSDFVHVSAADHSDGYLSSTPPRKAKVARNAAGEAYEEASAILTDAIPHRRRGAEPDRRSRGARPLCGWRAATCRDRRALRPHGSDLRRRRAELRAGGIPRRRRITPPMPVRFASPVFPSRYSEAHRQVRVPSIRFGLPL